MGAVTSRTLQISEKPVRDKENARSKDRLLEQVPSALWQLFRELCDGQHKWPLFLYGPSGTGKSCAALCLLDRIPGAKFFHMPALDRQVQEIKQGTAEWYELGRGGTWTMKGWWNYITNLPLIVLDDVGLPEVSSDSQAETLFMALEAREGKPLICTSNLNDEEIATTYNTRIQSRMCSGTKYNLMGRDRRYDDKPVTAAKKTNSAPKTGA
jgi:DNA replication protein DnaC